MKIGKNNEPFGSEISEPDRNSVENLPDTSGRNTDEVETTVFIALEKTSNDSKNPHSTVDSTYVRMDSFDEFEDRNSDDEDLADQEEAVNHADTIEFIDDEDDEFNCIEDLEINDLV